MSGARVSSLGEYFCVEKGHMSANFDKSCYHDGFTTQEVTTELDIHREFVSHGQNKYEKEDIQIPSSDHVEKHSDISEWLLPVEKEKMLEPLQNVSRVIASSFETKEELPTVEIPLGCTETVVRLKFSQVHVFTLF